MTRKVIFLTTFVETTTFMENDNEFEDVRNYTYDKGRHIGGNNLILEKPQLIWKMTFLENDNNNENDIVL